MIQGTSCQEHQCGTCGVWYALPDIIIDTARREGGFFSCPNGHERGWHRKDCETEADRVRRERDRLEQRLAEKDDEIQAERKRTEIQKRSAAAYKAHLTKTKKRIDKGVCPCCNRSFHNLRRHMQTKHPDFLEQEAPGLEVIAGGKK